MAPEWFQWSALLLGGGGLAGIVSAVVTWRHSTSDQWRDIVSAQTEHLIKPLEERISTLEQQVSELEGYRDHYMLAVEYLRKLFHWLARITDRIDMSILEENPKPHLPDEIRGEFGELCDKPDSKPRS